MITARANIWTKLLLAFVFISSLTLLVSVMALLIFNHSSTLMKEIAEEHLPEIIQVADFARIGGEIVAVAPAILSAPDDDMREEVKKDLDRLLQQLSEQLQALTIPQSELRSRVEKVVIRLQTNLDNLQKIVALQVDQQRILERKMERLRWLYADLMGELDPLSQDYAYNVDAEVERIVDSAASGSMTVSTNALHQLMDVEEAIQTTRSDSAILVNLMMQAATISNRDRLDNMALLAEESILSTLQDIGGLQDDVSSHTLRQTLAYVRDLAIGGDSVFSVKATIIDYDREGQQILIHNRIHVSELNRIIDELVAESEEKVNTAVQSTSTTLKRAHTALILTILLSFITVAAVMWFYVRGSIVMRLSDLSKSMLAISGGDLSHEVLVGGKDEIGRMAEALKRFRDTAVEVEEANAQAIIDNAAVGLILSNPDGTIHAMNPKAEELFGVKPDELAGASVFTIVEAGDRGRFADTCSNILKEACDAHDVATYRTLKIDGTSFPSDIFITRVQQRNSIRLMITVHDVTEREHAQELLRIRVRDKTEHLHRINKQLREEMTERKRVQDELVQAGKLAALGQLSAGIAHELNQPLSAIRYYLHNAGKLLERDEIVLHKENLDKIEELIERMASMINHLKNFARRRQDGLGTVDLIEVIDRSLEIVGGKLAKHHIQITRDDGEPRLQGYGEITGLEQVLLNVIGNAIDAVLRNPPDHREITIVTGERNGGVVIDIIDNGPGLAAREANIVFDPFYTTKEVGQGLGLGLSISYNLIKGFGGSISAANRDGGGAVFTIILQKSAITGNRL
jgi:two-component system phosphoglycerate transport system sensor histidine kinase PgtB